ncbi:MAG: nucleotidyltransferase domain-containing protein [Chloroflexi bacterium]|nr:nucleotidyltransferase domain-containing protein [Chloroflexota bacterium]
MSEARLAASAAPRGGSACRGGSRDRGETSPGGTTQDRGGDRGDSGAEGHPLSHHEGFAQRQRGSQREPLLGAAAVAIRHHPEGAAPRPGGASELAWRHRPLEEEATGGQGALRLRPAGRRGPVPRLLRRDRGRPTRAVAGVFGGGVGKVVELREGNTTSKKIANQEVLTRYRDALLARFPDQLQRLILFGSQARGDATAGSDIDVLVVVSWGEERLPGGFYAAPFSDPRWQAIVDMASDISLEHGVYISPLVISERRFREWSPLIKRAREEGIEIWRKSQS